MSNEIIEKDREKLRRDLAEDLANCSLEELRYWFRMLQAAKKAVLEINENKALDG